MTRIELAGRRLVRRLDLAGYPATAEILNFWFRPRGPSLRGILRGMRWACLVLGAILAVEIVTLAMVGGW